MRIDRARWHVAAALLAAVAVLSGCNTATTLVKRSIGADAEQATIGRAVAGLADLPFASARVSSGRAFDGFVVLGSVDGRGVQTWYGREGMYLQMRGDRVIHSRGLPVDIAEYHDAEAVLTYDCGNGVEYVAQPGLFYMRLRESTEFIAAMRESLTCRVEALITPAYGGDALRIDESYRVEPHPRLQRRTVWLHPQTRQVLRLEYGEHPLAPELSIVWIRVPETGRP